MELSSGLDSQVEECGDSVFSRRRECYMRRTGEDAVGLMLASYIPDRPRSPIYRKAHIPRLLFRDPEIRRLSLLLSKANIVIMSADELVSQGLEAGEEERSGSGEMRHSQGQMRDGHIGRLVRQSRANVLEKVARRRGWT